MHNFYGIKRKTDNFRKGVYVDPYDEPTYLTFALDFNFGENSSSLTGNHLWESPLFNRSENSAADFLESRGYTAQQNGIVTFREILRYLTFNAPWYFQEISGLDKMWQAGTNIDKANKGVTLTINTLEAVDLRIAQMADIYRNAIYDKRYMRERVPDNLRWFSMDIYIAEARNLRYRLPGVAGNVANTLGINTGLLSNITGSGNVLSNVMEQYGFVKFRCRQCEFDFSESFSGGNRLSVALTNGKTEMASNSFKINVGYFEEESEYANGTRLFDDPIKTNIRNPWSAQNLGTAAQNVGSFLSGLPVIGDNITNAGEALQNAFAQVGGLINPSLQAASQFLNPSPNNLGNIYGND